MNLRFELATACEERDVLKKATAYFAKQIGELLEVIAVAHPVITQDVAVVPEFLDDGCGIHSLLSSMFAIRVSRCVTLAT